MTMTLTSQVSLTTKRKGSTVSMTSMAMARRQTSKTRRRSKTKFEFIKTIRRTLKKTRRVRSSLRQKDGITETTHPWMETSRMQTEWTLNA